MVLRPSPSHAKLLSPLSHRYEAQNDEKLVWEGVSDTRCAVHQAAEIQSTSSKLRHKHLSSPPPSPRVHLSEEPLPCSRKHFIAMLIFSATQSHYFIDFRSVEWWRPRANQGLQNFYSKATSNGHRDSSTLLTDF